MGTCIAVYLDARHMPDAQWLANAVQAMAPKLEFVDRFDPIEDSGHVPCRIGGRECGFEWEAGYASELPAALRGQRFDSCFLATYRSSADDRACAVLIAANVAHIAGGVLESPDGALVDGAQVLHWATDMLGLHRKPLA